MVIGGYGVTHVNALLAALNTLEYQEKAWRVEKYYDSKALQSLSRKEWTPPTVVHVFCNIQYVIDYAL
jgi:hypothetical protein